MNGKYDDIKHLSRPEYKEFPPMPIKDRAAQFSPFEALVGYTDAVTETARLTESKAELSEDQANELNAALNLLLDRLIERPEIRLTYFISDKKKAGGKYVDKTGTVRIFDSYSKELVFTDGERVAVDNMFRLEFTRDGSPTE